VTNSSFFMLNELLREDNQDLNQTIVFTFDAGGNIKTKSIYAYTTPGVTPTNPTKTYTYTYGNANWTDLLTSLAVTTYSGGTSSTKSINLIYDTNVAGNPTSYDGNSLTWTWGRSLASFNNSAYNSSYTYNNDGLRTKKTVKNNITGITTTTYYTYEGNKVIWENTDPNSSSGIKYSYDSNGKLLSMNDNGTEYYYVFNAQGDVIGLLDTNGTQVVTYKYDAWGNLTSITGTLASTVGQKNPYRYRGYRYDSETGLYYLESRYYNPELGRFLNADDPNVSSFTLSSFSNKNLFAYCDNNPVMNIDPNGKEDVSFYSAWWGYYIYFSHQAISNLSDYFTLYGIAGGIGFSLGKFLAKKGILIASRF
jgi:RHS repeat-associated protein